MNREMALRIVASMVAANLLRDGTPVEWENYPEIGEHDWADIAGRVREMSQAFMPPKFTRERAYEFLAAQADTHCPPPFGCPRE